jgi:hypothetical protein
MTVAHNALADLEALAYEAALEPSLWPQVAVGAAKAFQAPHARLGVVDRQRGVRIMDAPSRDLRARRVLAESGFPNRGRSD